jgi:hypothetical protein
MAHLHSTLYGLVLGILDDLFANTKIRIMSDTITLDVVARDDFPATEGDKNGSSGGDNNNEKEGTASISGGGEGAGVSVAYFSSATFIAGLGLGLTLSAFVNEKR